MSSILTLTLSLKYAPQVGRSSSSLVVRLAACLAYLQHSQRDCHNHSICLPATAVGAVHLCALSTPLDAGHRTPQPHIQPLCQALCQRLQAAGMTMGSPGSAVTRGPASTPACVSLQAPFNSRPRHFPRYAAVCKQQGQQAFAAQLAHAGRPPD